VSLNKICLKTSRLEVKKGDAVAIKSSLCNSRMKTLALSSPQRDGISKKKKMKNNDLTMRNVFIFLNSIYINYQTQIVTCDL
jgi:hypothetical protein